MAFLFFLLSATTPQVPAATYRCLDDTMFTLSASPTMAIVRFRDGGIYRLPRRSSAIALKYSTKQATLYIDGEFAAFVADDRELPGCFRVKTPPRPAH